MSLLGSFLGNAAGAGAQIIGDRMKADDLLKNQTEYAKMQSELQLERDKTIEEMRQKTKIADEERQRNQLATDSKSINDESDKIRLGRIANIINEKNGTNLKPEDVQYIANNPAALKAYGIDDRTRASEMDDKAGVAEKMGLLGHMKNYRDQQTLELNKTREDNRDASTNKRLDWQEQFQTMQAELAGRREDRRTALEGARLSKADTQMEKAELASKRQSVTSVMNDIGKEQDRLTTLMSQALDDKQKSAYETQIRSLEKERTLARSYLKELGGMEIPARSNNSVPDPFPKGTIKNGFEYLGGDTSNKSNWKQIQSKSEPAKKEEKSDGVLNQLTPNAAFKLNSKLDAMSDADLEKIKPGHPSYEPAQQEIRRRKSEREPETINRGNFTE